MCPPNSARLLDKTFNYVVDAFRDIHQYCACFLLPIFNFVNMVLEAAKLRYSVFLPKTSSKTKKIESIFRVIHEVFKTYRYKKVTLLPNN